MQARNMGPRILKPSFEIQSILQSNFREPPLREHALAPKALPVFHEVSEHCGGDYDRNASQRIITPESLRSSTMHFRSPSVRT